MTSVTVQMVRSAFDRDDFFAGISDTTFEGLLHKAARAANAVRHNYLGTPLQTWYLAGWAFGPDNWQQPDDPRAMADAAVKAATRREETFRLADHVSYVTLRNVYRQADAAWEAYAALLV